MRTRSSIISSAGVSSTGISSITVGMTVVLVCFFLVTCQSDDEEPDAECGNGLRESGELCDGADLGDVTCGVLGLGTGEVTCNDQCHLVLSGCSQAPDCGNDLREPGEVCDGSDLGGLDCNDLGFDGGELVCRADCDVDLASCCSDDCPTGGETRCEGDVVQTCDTAADGCLGWADTTDCSLNSPAQICDASDVGAVCADPCQDLCTTEGEQQCATDTIETCLPTATGCLDWIELFDCGANVPAQTCDATAGEATCIAPCQTDCTADDQLHCNGDNLESCVELTPGCFQWVHVQDCTTFYCGACFESTWDTDMASCQPNC